MKDKSKDECRGLAFTNLYLLEFSISIKYIFTAYFLKLLKGNKNRHKLGSCRQ